MAVDYAGAVAAIKSRFLAAWINGAARKTPVAFQNEVPNDGTNAIKPWPPQDTNGRGTPWVYFEVIQTESRERGVGLPGNKVWLTSGNIFAHVFVPLDYGLADALTLAEAAGVIFRAQTFYVDNSVGAKIVCGAASVQGGDSNADDGNWFGVTVSVPFEFYFIA